jgi:hypothetical protein
MMTFQFCNFVVIIGFIHCLILAQWGLALHIIFNDQFPFSGLIVSCGLAIHRILLMACLCSPVFLKLSLLAFLVGITLIQPSTSDALISPLFPIQAYTLSLKGDVKIYIISFVRIFYI